MDTKEIIQKEFKPLTKVFSINLAVRIINLVLMIIFAVLNIHNFTVAEYVVIFTGCIICIVIPIASIWEIQSIVIAPNLDSALTTLKSILKLFIFIPFWSVISFFVTSIKSTAFILGYTSLGSISMIICFFMTLVAYGNIKTVKYESEKEQIVAERIDTMKRKQAEEERKRRIATENKKQETALRLLEEIGRKFYVKYYEKLRNWSIPDIIDVIEENYTEESKTSRIKKAKKLFENDLNITALEIIANDTQNLTDDETRSAANELLAKQNK